MSKKSEKTTAEAVEEVKTEETVIASDEIVVSDPQILRPKELPLVVTGNWKNSEQEEFARTLNGYAYKNPEKWAKKKDVLIAQLRELGTNPGLIEKLRGVKGNLSYKNRLIESE